MYNFMIEIKAKTKKWGNSVGIILPKKLGMQPDQEITLHIETHPVTTVKDIYGLFAGKIGNVEKLMKEIDEELHGDE